MGQDSLANKIADFSGNTALDSRQSNSYLRRHVQTDSSLEPVSCKMGMKHFHRG